MKFYASDDLQPVIQELDGVSIGVFLTYRQSGIKRNFRCINCGKLTFQYEGEVALLLEAQDKPKNSGSTEHLCTRCRVTYAILW